MPTFVLTLDEALRAGAIVRGMDLTEEEVQQSENIAHQIRTMVLQSGDENLVKLIRKLPDESFSRLKKILFDK